MPAPTLEPVLSDCVAVCCTRTGPTVSIESISGVCRSLHTVQCTPSQALFVYLFHFGVIESGANGAADWPGTDPKLNRCKDDDSPGVCPGPGHESFILARLLHTIYIIYPR